MAIGSGRAGGRHSVEWAPCRILARTVPRFQMKPDAARHFVPGLHCLLTWIFCVLVLLPLFVGILSLADLCRGKKPRLLARDPKDADLMADYE